ncbi:hypothetical protein ET33_26990 [Paenibacillus tyrfis]|uniref:Uncharacterized protein n=1 Tax=Paenibacillus tyrfis TaxID=1501230 RepID=A0A081NUV5_9BACL|nr:hypothetical protein ET33_26990 [Paenibacillus tyrfis]
MKKQQYGLAAQLGRFFTDRPVKLNRIINKGKFFAASLRGMGLNICVQAILFSALRFNKAAVA